MDASTWKSTSTASRCCDWCRVYEGFVQAPTDIDKYQYLRAVQERQEILFYALLEKHLDEMLPIVYTPTVGAAVQQFSALYQNPRGLSYSPLNIDRADQTLECYPMEDVRMIVATDSSAILGIGTIPTTWGCARSVSGATTTTSSSTSSSRQFGPAGRMR